MTFDEWKYDYALVYEPNYCEETEADCLAAFNAGAASRDAEVQHLQFALADTEALEIAAGEKIDQLRAQINDLRKSLLLIKYETNIHGNNLNKSIRSEVMRALATTPEQSLSEYRNKVIEDCSVTIENCEPDDNGRLSIQEIAEAVLAMKEQP